MTTPLAPRKTRAAPVRGYNLRLKDGQQFQLDSQLTFVRECMDAQATRDYFAKRFECRRDDLETRGVARATTLSLWPEILYGMRRWTPAKESAGGEDAVGPMAFRYEPLCGDTIGRTTTGALAINQLISPLELIGAPLRPTAKVLTFYRTNGVWWLKVVWGRHRRKRLRPRDSSPP